MIYLFGAVDLYDIQQINLHRDTMQSITTV